MKRIKDRSINLDLKNLRNIPVLRTELSEEEREGEKIVGKCPHASCKGSVIEVRVRKFNPIHGAQIIGPGGRSQWYMSTSYHCDTCMTMVTGPPKK